MKIRLAVEDHLGGPRAMISFFVKSEKINLKLGIVNFIVDSGSPNTMISSEALKPFRASMIKIRRLEKRKIPIGFGGSEINPRILDDAEFIGLKNFKTNFPVLICDEENATHANVLGVDFLEEHNFTFTFNPKKREAYLEIEEESELCSNDQLEKNETKKREK